MTDNLKSKKACKCGHNLCQQIMADGDNTFHIECFTCGGLPT